MPCGTGAGRTIFTITLSVDVEHSDSTLVTHTLLGNADDLTVVLAECHSLDGCREFPLVQALSGFYVPET